jgi:hypothetical protein
MIGTSFDTATTALATKMITHAENEINKYLVGRYDVSAFNTSTAIPPLVTSLCETLSEGYMHQRMSRGGKESMARGAALIKQALDNLKMISEYNLSLSDSTGALISDRSDSNYAILSSTTNYTTTFDEDDELNWEIDSDKLNDIESGRD